MECEGGGCGGSSRELRFQHYPTLAPCPSPHLTPALGHHNPSFSLLLLFVLRHLLLFLKLCVNKHIYQKFFDFVDVVAVIEKWLPPTSAPKPKSSLLNYRLNLRRQEQRRYRCRTSISPLFRRKRFPLVCFHSFPLLHFQPYFPMAPKN
jgi:hypothetical protein